MLRRQVSVVHTADGALDEIKKDFDFVKRFDLGPEEVLIKTYRAQIKNSHGKMYISQNFIGFHAQVFGRKIKVNPDLFENIPANYIVILGTYIAQVHGHVPAHRRERQTVVQMVAGWQTQSTQQNYHIRA
jgi:hypothetical protein